MAPGPVSPKIIGQRLAIARKRRGLTQDQVAIQMGMSRPTLIAIEKGIRAARNDEIIALARLYGRSVHELVQGNDVPAVELRPHLRAALGPNTQDDAAVDESIALLERHALHYRQLEEMLGAPLRAEYPSEAHVPVRGDVVGWADDLAERERARMGLGDQPIYRLRDLLEAEVGLRIFYGSMPSFLAGMYSFDTVTGPCILVNRKHKPERRRSSIAHEYGHFLIDRHKPGIDYTFWSGRKPASERFVEPFGMSFLIPRSGIRRHFAEVLKSAGDFTVADLCRVSALYYVSVQAMAVRLEQLDLIPKGSYEYLLERRFKPQLAKEEMGLAPDRSDGDNTFSSRYVVLAVKAYDQGLLTEGQFAQFLDVDRAESRRIASDWREKAIPQGSEGDGGLPFDQSLFKSHPEE